MLSHSGYHGLALAYGDVCLGEVALCGGSSAAKVFVCGTFVVVKKLCL